MQERAKGAQHIYQSQKRKEKHLETQNEPNPSPSIPQSSKRSQIALKCVFFVKIRKKNSKGAKMLEKIKELRVKAECAKALLALADDETERKHFKNLPSSHTPPLFFSYTKKARKKVKLWAEGQTNLILFFCFFLSKKS